MVFVVQDTFIGALNNPPVFVEAFHSGGYLGGKKRSSQNFLELYSSLKIVY